MLDGFEIVGKITDVEIIAVGSLDTDLALLEQGLRPRTLAQIERGGDSSKRDYEKDRAG